MAYVQVDVDMEEFETYELVKELCRRLRSNRIKKQLTDKEKKELKETLVQINEALFLTPIKSIEIKTLEDKMKYDHLAKVWNNYNSEQIEKLLP